jgi:hypothetical protein
VEALAQLREFVRDEERHATVTYHLKYPNGGGVPYPAMGAYFPRQWDCVGAVMAFLKCDRVQLSPPWPFYVDEGLGYGYVNTDTMIKDADGPRHLFEDATKNGWKPYTGDIVVFPSKWGLLGRTPGHVGILSGNRKVVHCSPSNTRKLGHALAETDARVFLRRTDRRYLRYRHWIGE